MCALHPPGPIPPSTQHASPLSGQPPGASRGCWRRGCAPSWAQDEAGGDVGIGLALGNQGKNFVFAVRQLREELRGATLRGWSSAAEVAHQVLGDGRTKDGLAVRHGTDGAQGLFLHGTLEEIAARSSANGGEDGLVILKHREDQNADVRTRLQDAARGLNAIDTWHLNIHQNDIRLQ